MATAATEIKPVSEPELISNILTVHEDDPCDRQPIESPEPLANPMEALALSSYGQMNQFPIYSPEMDEKLGCLEITDEAPASSPVKESNPFSSSSSNLTLANDLKPPQAHRLFADNEQTREYIRQESWTQTNEDRTNFHQAGSYTDLNGRQFKERECPDTIDIPFNFSDAAPRRRHVWGSDRHNSLLRNEGGYNSDGDVSRNRSKNENSPGVRPCDSYEESPEFGTFQKGHRRVRSGDALVESNIDSPPPFPDAYRGEGPSVVHSQSQGSVQHVQSMQPPFNQSISVDCTPVEQNQVHEHLCAQSTMFVNLQQAITEATKEYERLVTDVDAKFHELNVGLSVEHRTHKDCKLLEAEIYQLRKEIQAMYDECDQSGIQVPGDPPELGNRPISELYPSYPTSPTGPNAVSQNMTHVYPSSPNNPLRPIPVTPPPPPIITQPRKRPKSSPYENIPDYTRNDYIRNDPTMNVPVDDNTLSQSPPPLPPRQPMMIAMRPANEKWRCPACTFDNLLVANCEMCQTPRPCVLRNNTPR